MAMIDHMIEYVALLGFALLVCQYCYKEHARGDAPGGADDPDTPEDLQRFRARLTERRSGRRGGEDAAEGPPPPDKSAEGREQLIENNISFREIRREESVRELAASRGGAADAERGEAAAEDLKLAVTRSLSESSESSLPAPPSPPPQGAAVDTIAVALATPPDPPSSANHPPALEPVRQFWSSLTNNLTSSERLGSERPKDDASSPPETRRPTKPAASLECAICLDPYAPGDVVAWARDGVDPQTSTSTNDHETGCNHIFHKECLVAWLQEHDDCPLCRRRMVHGDAAVRLAG